MRTIIFDVRARTPERFDFRVVPQRIISGVSATVRNNPTAVRINSFQRQPAFFQEAHGFVGDGFSGHNERHYFRMICVVVFTDTDTGTNERDGTAT
jgi:hypothetical protein